MLTKKAMLEALEGSFAKWSPWDAERRLHLFELTYGIDCEPETMEQIADHYGISGGRVQQLVSLTAVTLARKLGMHELDEFVRLRGKPVTKTYVWHQRPPSEYLTRADSLREKRSPWTRLAK